MKTKIYYMLVNKKGNPITIDAQLPIYYFKIVAAREAMKHKCYITRVQINHIDEL